jgi:photosystem II stability/assembly factor-like uncharacterized protein
MTTPRSLHRYIPILLASILALVSLACSAIVTTLPGATQASPTAATEATTRQPPPEASATPSVEEPATLEPVSEPTAVPSETPAAAKEAEQLGPTREPKPVVSPTVAAASFPVGRWQGIPDLPRQISAVLGDPDDPRVLYAATGAMGAGGGVYQSKDLGLSWRLVAEGLPSEDIRALGLSRAEPATLYAVVGHRGDVFASTDGARSWTRVGNYQLTGYIARLAVASNDGNVLFVAEDVRGLYRSLDGGASWVPLGGGLPTDDNGAVNVQSLALDPVELGVVYVGTGWGSFDGNGVWKSTDSGETWAAANRGMIDYGITALAVHPTDSQVIYAGGNGSEFWKSTDGGQSWRELTDVLPIDGGPQQPIRDIVIDPAVPDRMVLLHERAGLLASADGGERWQLLGKPAELEYPMFTAMSVLFGSQPVVVVGVRDEGGWRYAAP